MAMTSPTAVAAALSAAGTAASCHPSCRSSTCPPWLQAALADIEQRVQALAVSAPSGAASDSFAERAEHYYEKRPQLIALLQDLHHRYLYLADRYSQSLLKPAANLHHRRRSSSVPPDFDAGFSAAADYEFDDCASASSDAESSLSFQPPIQAILTSDDAPPKASGATAGAPPVLAVIAADLDLLVAELVSTAVERDLRTAEAAEADRRLAESSRKIELQGSLVEVLESERLVLLGENARLGFRAAAAEEEARAGAAELGYMRRRAAELARAVVKLREDHRVCMLGRRIEGLQSQIYALERRNRECLDAMARREKEHGEARAETERLRSENRRLREEEEGRRARRRKWWAPMWWGRGRKEAEDELGPWTCAAHVRKGSRGGKGDKGCFRFY